MVYYLSCGRRIIVLFLKIKYCFLMLIDITLAMIRDLCIDTDNDHITVLTL